jgi:hypothetical protein
MQGLVADESARWDLDAKRRAAEQVGSHCRCYPSCWHVVGLRGWWPGHRDSVAEAEWAAEDTVASKQLPEVVAESWELAVRTLKGGWRDMAEAHPGVTARKRCRTLAALEVAARHEGSWGSQGSCCAFLQRMQHLPLVVLAELVLPGLSALKVLRLAAAVGRLVLGSVMRS